MNELLNYKIDFTSVAFLSYLARVNFIEGAIEMAAENADWSDVTTANQAVGLKLVKKDNLVMYNLGRDPTISVVSNLDVKNNNIVLPGGKKITKNTRIKYANVNWKSYLPQ